MSEMGSNTSPDLENKLHDQEAADRKKKRGASKLKLATDQQRPLEVDQNEFGQPIGKKSVELSTFLGCLTKKFVPYSIETWNDVSEEVKDKLWTCVQMKFKFENGESNSVFQRLNKLWRDGRSKLQTSIPKVNVGAFASRNLGLLKPDMMSSKEWGILVEKTMSPEFQEKRQKFIEMRQKHDHPHTMGRKGYARLAEQMKKNSTANAIVSRSKVWVKAHENNGKPSTQGVVKEILACAPDLQNTTNIIDDALSHVLGPEPRGRVRGVGFGVKPSQVGAQIQKNATVKQLQGSVQEIQKTLATLFEMIQNKQPEQIESGGVVSGTRNSINSGHDDNAANQNNGSKVNEFVATPQSNQGLDNPDTILENASCKLLHHNGDGIVVAEGRIASIDPKAMVHHILLGRSCWKVWVDNVIVKNEDLIRPNEEMSALDEALGSTVAWWPKLIVLDD